MHCFFFFFSKGTQSQGSFEREISKKNDFLRFGTSCPKMNKNKKSAHGQAIAEDFVHKKVECMQEIRTKDEKENQKKKKIT